MLNKKIRFFGEYTQHYLKKYYLAIILGAMFGGIIYLQKNNLNQIYQSLKTQDDYIGVEGLYNTNNLPSYISNSISYGLTTITENEKPKKSQIIKNLSVRNNDKDYIFTFVENLIWHNGKKFSTSDIELNIPGITKKVTGSNEITISVESSFAPLLASLNKPLLLKDSLIGLGQNKVTNVIFQDGFVKSLKLTEKESRKKTIYRFYSNTDDLVNGFKLGEVDTISTDMIDEKFKDWPNLKVTQSIATDKYSAVFLNTNKLSNKQIRQALAYATPKSLDKNNRCLGPISPNSWAYSPQVKEYLYNPARALELLGENKVENISLVVTDRKLLKTAETIKDSWEKTFNIKVEIKAQTQQLDLENYDAIVAYGSVPNDPDQYQFWHSTQSITNVTHLNNSRIDKLLEDGRQVQDQLERKKIYADFQRFLLEESPVIFLDFPITYTISRIK